MSNNNQATEEKVETTNKNKVVEVKAKDVAKTKKKKEKVKKPNKVVKSLKDTGNELKKVSWPGFKQVVKQTGIVLVFVLIFAVVIFGFERLCSWLAGLLI
jgi:preprotein translocase SecE subunit